MSGTMRYVTFNFSKTGGNMTDSCSFLKQHQLAPGPARALKLFWNKILVKLVKPGAPILATHLRHPQRAGLIAWNNAVCYI